jgi:hypothetical protein
MTVGEDGFVPVQSDMLFHTHFADEAPQEFTTLQAAMAHAEDLDSPTGTIDFGGEAIVTYTGGDIDVA